MSRVFTEYYRCPPELADFAPPSGLSAQAGFFAFGSALCYGRRTGAADPISVAGDLPDASLDVKVDDGRLCLRFDFSEVVTNLREERYPSNSNKALGKLTDSFASRSLYYLLRPMLSVSIRKHLQRLHLNGWRNIRFPTWPVDVTVESVMKKAMALTMTTYNQSNVPFIWFWPDGASSCGILTHDVEAEGGRDFCNELMDLDESCGFKSSFQIVPEGRYTGSQALSATVRGRGFEANIHDLNHDGQLFRNRSQFLERAAQINKYGRAFHALGFRSAAMYRSQEWFSALEFRYDMSVPNVAHLEPQRGGCCTVMPYFVGNTLELPLTTIQDYSLFHILDDYSIALWKKQIDIIRAEHGLITILTHPDYLIEARARAAYRELLVHLAKLRDEDNVWFALPSAVDAWWRNRSQMTLVRDGQSWRVDGAGSDRARIAYATLDGDRVVYNVQ